MTPNVNDIAPEFEVSDSAGTQRTLSQLVARERHVLLLYRGHW